MKYSEESESKENEDKEKNETNNSGDTKEVDKEVGQGEEKDTKNKKKLNKKLIIALSSIASIIFVIIVIFGVSSFKRNQTIKQAESLISMGKFEDAIAIYDNLLIKKYIPELVSKRESAIELMESDENLVKGLEAFDDDNKDKAIKYLSKVPKSDKARYKKALDKLNDLEEATAVEVEELIANGNLEEATKIVNDYLKLFPDSVDMQNASEDIASKRTQIENEAVAAEQAKKDQEAADAKAAKAEAAIQRTNEEARNIALSLKGSYKSIISKEANLRDAPTLSSNIITALPRGTVVYIYDTQIESPERIWCQVRDDYDYYYGWVSYNTMNYKIK